MSSSLFSSLHYGELDAAQKASVAYLFADHLCDSDPLAFRYECNKEKEIIGRVPLQKAESTRPKKIQSHALASVPSPQPTPDEIARVREATRQLAQLFFARMNQSVEVTV